MSRVVKKKYLISILLFVLLMATSFVLTNWLKPLFIYSDGSDPITDTPKVVKSDTPKVDKPVINPVSTNNTIKPMIPTPPKRKKQTKEELTRIINNPSNNDYPRDVKLKYNNLLDTEESQNSINNIRSYIKLGVWESVRVTDVTYDETTGRVTSITITINRKKENDNTENNNIEE